MPPVENIDLQLKKAFLILCRMVILAGALAALYFVWPVLRFTAQVLSPFLIGLVIAYLFHPIVNFAQKRLKIGRVAGILVVALLVVFLFLGFFGLLLPILNTQASNLIEAVQNSVPPLVEKLSHNIHSKTATEWWGEFNANLKKNGFNLRENINKIMSTTAEVMGGGAHAIQGAAAGIGAFVTRMAGTLAMLLFALVTTFYYLLEFHKIPEVIRLLIPVKHEEKIMDVLAKVDTAVGGFLRGQLIDCTLVGLLTMTGLFLVGMKQYAVLIGVIAGAANFIPYLGPAIGATPAILWALLSADHATWGDKGFYLLIVLGVFLVIQTADALFFQPRIVGQSSNLHPLLVMLALVIGASIGLAGMVLAVPVACIIRVLILELWWKQHLKARQEAERLFAAVKE